MSFNDSNKLKAELAELEELEDLERNGTELRFLYASKPAPVQKKPESVPRLQLYGNIPAVVA